jgi:Ca2+-binding EF-hand superfamily protein
MMFVGVTAMGVGIATARDLQQLKKKFANEGTLKEKWDAFDKNKNGSLDLKELTELIHSFDMDLSRNEIAATYLALGKITFSSSWITF